MRGSPVLWSRKGDVHSAVELKGLRSEANAEGAYKEEDLQWLIDECPGVLPINEFLPRARNVWSLGREIPVDLGGSQGFIDNLLVTDTGHLVVVETKLWRNPDALRQVVTQIIHYAMGLQAAELDSVVRKGDKRSKNQLGATESVAQRVNGMDEALLGFEDQLDDHLRKGEMLLLIVGDRTRRTADRFASWLAEFKALPFTLGVVELPLYRTATGETLVVPRSVLRTKEVSRHVVVVSVSNATASEVTARLEGSVVQASGAIKTSETAVRSSAQMDETRLLSLAAAQSSAKGAKFVSELIPFLKAAGFDSRETSTELHFGIREQIDETFSSLISLQAKAMYAVQPSRLFDVVSIEEIAAHRRGLNDCAAFYSPDAVANPVRGSGKGSRVPKYDDVRVPASDLAMELTRFRDLARSKLDQEEI